MESPKLSNYHLDRFFGPVSGPSYVYPPRGAQTVHGSGLDLTSAGTTTFKAYAPR